MEHLERKEGGTTNLEKNRSGDEEAHQGNPPGEEVIGGEWTAFIDNLSRRVSWATLRELFGHYGKVTRVFIPEVNTKAKYKQNTFAFISMSNKEEMFSVISKLHNTRIDGRVISVSQAKFPKQQTAARNICFSNGKERCNRVSSGSVEKENRSPVSNGVARGCNTGEKMSYRDALLRNIDNSNRQNSTTMPLDEAIQIGCNDGDIFDVELPPSEVNWLECCLVGILKNSYESGVVQQAFDFEGIIATVCKWGLDCNSYVIRFNSPLEMEESWNSKREALCFWFKYLSPLMVDKVPLQYASITLRDVPLMCWFENFFRSLGNRWGCVRRC
ncbi:hypothetical protein HRI_004605100 [Hibiscus trionum]|uniref:RRM domain-containing protein n=1 Tax=Hibiscus trionum TaxID=183268 RepID=A0A9W7JCT5_HIBTR|nr:hypothetical protein HRI_004605100 [Hibiscus trionum]